jgi:hypothetical protein
MLPRSPSLRQRRQRKFRREHGAEIEQRLEGLRRIWEDGQPGIRAKHDPQVVDAAVWFCDDIGWPKPPWLAKLAAKFPSKKVSADAKVGDVITYFREHTDSRKGRPPADEVNIRAFAEQDLKRRGDPGMGLDEYAKEVRGRLFPEKPDDEPPTCRTVKDIIGRRPSLWQKYVKPRT